MPDTQETEVVADRVRRIIADGGFTGRIAARTSARTHGRVSTKIQPASGAPLWSIVAMSVLSTIIEQSFPKAEISVADAYAQHICFTWLP